MYKQDWGHWPGLLKTKQNKIKQTIFGEYFAFQPCLIQIYGVGRQTLEEGERINVDVFVFKLISRVNIVIKYLEFKFLPQYFTMKNIFWGAEEACQVWLLEGPIRLVDEWGTSCQLWTSSRFIYRLPLLGAWTLVLQQKELEFWKRLFLKV